LISYWLWLFLILIFILGIIGYNGLLSLIPVIITTLYFISTYFNNMKVVRLVFFFCSMVWFYYNYQVGAYTALIGNVFEFTSGLIALFRFDNGKYNKLYYRLKELPKIELHLHLDGSVNLKTLSSLSNKSLEEVKKEAVAPLKCNDLKEYLIRFTLPVKVMQTKDNLQLILSNLLETLDKQNVIYAEIRFAPSLHTKNMTQEEVVKSLLEVKDKYKVKTNLILCMMRHNSYELNKETIDVAKKYLGKGVCAIDLAGDEANFKTSSFKELFEYANKLGVPYTIHAGEADDHTSVMSALDMGAKRIGHGINCIENEDTINRLIREKICLEVCPTSNVQTNVVKDISSHPIKQLYKKGVLVTVNTDNMTVSNTNLIREYGFLIRILGFTIDDIIKMNKVSIQNAFLSEEEKRQLLNRY